MKVATGILVWLLCGFLSFGFDYAHHQSEFPYNTCSNKRWERENFSESFAMFLFGPIGLILSPIMDGGWEDGWTLKNKCEAARTTPNRAGETP